MEDKNITFEDLPKAMSWMMDKLNKLDSKIDGLNNIPQVRPADQWMNLKELWDTGYSKKGGLIEVTIG